MGKDDIPSSVERRQIEADAKTLFTKLIDTKYKAFSAKLGKPNGPVTLHQSSWDGNSQLFRAASRRYELGEIYCQQEQSTYGSGAQPRFLTHAVYGLIYSRWEKLDGRVGFLGNPISDVRSTVVDGGYFCDFQQGSIYQCPGTSIARVIPGEFRAMWKMLGAEQSHLGFPTSEMAGDDERYITFEHGVIVSRGKYGMHVVSGTHHLASFDLLLLDGMFARAMKEVDLNIHISSSGSYVSIDKSIADTAHLSKNMWILPNFSLPFDLLMLRFQFITATSRYPSGAFAATVQLKGGGYFSIFGAEMYFSNPLFTAVVPLEAHGGKVTCSRIEARLDPSWGYPDELETGVLGISIDLEDDIAKVVTASCNKPDVLENAANFLDRFLRSLMRIGKESYVLDVEVSDKSMRIDYCERATSGALDAVRE